MEHGQGDSQDRSNTYIPCPVLERYSPLISVLGSSSVNQNIYALSSPVTAVETAIAPTATSLEGDRDGGSSESVLSV